MRMALMSAGQTPSRACSLLSHGQNGNAMLQFLGLVYEKHDQRTEIKTTAQISDDPVHDL